VSAVVSRGRRATINATKGHHLSVIHAVALYVCLVVKEAEIHVLIITWFVDMVHGAGYFSI
jgi:hypothetical protein